jgi:hypothetical protein
MVPIKVPEAPLVEIVRTLASIAPDLERKRRLVAAEWLSDLHNVIKAWNDKFIKLLKTYPGCRNSNNPSAYKLFFEKLEKNRGDMLYRYRNEETVERLCGPIIRLYQQFPEQFFWLKERNSEAYQKISGLISNAYQSEKAVIDMADDFIGAVYGWDIPDISRTRGHSDEINEKFINENIKHHSTICQRIKDYEKSSEQSVADISRIAREGDLHLTPFPDASVKRSPGYTDPRKILMHLNDTPQKENKTLYTLLSFVFGVVFLTSLLAIAIWIPNPEPFQLKIFTTVLALAAGGTTTVMTGLINTEVKFGTQLVVGATGTLAIFVIVYMVNPAVL